MRNERRYSVMLGTDSSHSHLVRTSETSKGFGYFYSGEDTLDRYISYLYYECSETDLTVYMSMSKPYQGMLIVELTDGYLQTSDGTYSASDLTSRNHVVTEKFNPSGDSVILSFDRGETIEDFHFEFSIRDPNYMNIFMEEVDY